VSAQARAWVRWAGAAGTLSWAPQVVGSHWSRQVQVDVAAVNWQTRQILLGECKWGDERVSRTIVRELIGAKTPLVLQTLPQGGQDWRVTHALFTRTGLTEAAAQELAAHGGIAVDVQRLMHDLAQEEAV
jgi:hypothetical protein